VSGINTVAYIASSGAEFLPIAHEFSATFLILIKVVVVTLYFTALMCLALYGLHNMVMVLLYWWTRNKPTRPETIADWPSVTVQLPTYNERYMLERLLRAVTNLDYPREKLQVQLLDDSTDVSAVLARRLVEQYRERGHNIGLIQRTDRRGFKAGALAGGLRTALGELIAIFDADFVPPPDWLKRTVPYFADPSLGCLQTRWGHLNPNQSSFAQTQSLGIDGHFVIEQAARSRSGLLLNFNGSAGIWRRFAIEDAGGWQADTLTEDLDLSYRAQLRGWRFDYLPDVIVPAELPAQVEAYKKQQFRWAKGSFQVVRKLMAPLLLAKLPIHKRLLGALHISGYFVCPLMVAVLLLWPWVGLLAPQFLQMLPWTMLTAFGPPLMYLAAESGYRAKPMERLRLIPLLIIVGFGLSFNNTVAAVQGLFGRDIGTFVRTPKFNTANRVPAVKHESYVPSVGPLLWGEIALGLYALLALLMLVPRLGWEIAPWLTIYIAGYFYIAGLNLLQTWQNERVHAVKSAILEKV